MTTTPSAATVDGPASPTTQAHARLRPVSLGDVRITSGLWHERGEANRQASIPSGLERLHEAGNLRNLDIAAGLVQGEAEGPVFADSDVYKWLEAAAWEYARTGDEKLLADQLSVTETVARAQAEDGYLDSVVQIRENGQRYRDRPHGHEHYVAGHLLQAAVAQVRCTGRRDLLEVAIRLADHLVATFGPHAPADVDGHPVVEMALVELYRETGTRAYLDLAAYFVETRGHGVMASHGREPTYFSDRVPVREATTVEGHAVRAVYLAAGAADVATETGDAELLSALATQYASMERGKQYITGGLGSRWDGEAFGDPYELPTDHGYAETCAAIGGVQWAWRMLLATGQACYADQIERMLFNGFLAGVSLSGTEYFYVNPLQLRVDAHPESERSVANGRRGWFACACCPPNIMRMFSSLSAHVATTTEAGVQIHQYANGSIAAAGLRLDVETAYPWDGRVQVTVREAPGTPVELAFRIPAWAAGATLDGRPVEAGDYARVSRAFGQGDRLVLDLPMEPRLTRADERVDAVRGCVTIERGPLVYALEQSDQAGDAPVDDLRIVPGAAFEVEHRPDLLGGVSVVRTTGRVASPPSSARSPYAPASESASAPNGRVATDAGGSDDVTLVAIPYYAWANRGPQPMRVWVPTA